MHIARILEASVERYPSHNALVFGERRWTYFEWYGRIRRFAAALSDLGVRPSDRVAFYVSTSENSVTTYFACQVLGAVAVPLNYRLSAGEAAHILRDSGARVLIYGRHLTESALKIQEQVHSVHDFISCSYEKMAVPEGHHQFDELAEETEDRNILRPIPAGTDVSALVYTSGTTGRPKGVIHTHANDLAIAMNCVMEYGLNHKDNALHIAPLYHVGGMQAYFLPHLMVGGTNVVLGRYNALETLSTINSEKITTLFAVPTQINEMLLHPEFLQHDTSSLRLITTGGSAISSAVMERVIEKFCPNIFNGYGMTEASLTLILHPDDALRKLGSCGKPTLISECRIIERKPGATPKDLIAPSEVGQLIVRGPQVTNGYWNNPAATAKNLKEGWIYSGDLFSCDAEGFFYFHGRVDDMIVSGGENIYPREIEELLYTYPGIQEAAVLGLPDEKWGQSVAAYVVVSDPALTAEDLDTFCKLSGELAPYKRPKSYTFLDKLPTNPSGKVLKRELLAAFEATSAEQSQSN